MTTNSPKSSLFSGVFILVLGLLFFNLVYVFFCLNRSEIADAQAVLGRQILLGAVQNPETGDPVIGPQTESRSSDQRIFSELDLLLEGGIFAGKELPRIEVLELVALLHSMRQNWQTITQSQAGRTERSVFRHQALTLSVALTMRAMDLKASLWPPFWLTFALVLLMMAWLPIRRFFYPKKRALQAHHPVGSLADFESQLLMALPVAFILLDEFLSIRFVNRLGEGYFGQFSTSENSAFSDYCNDQTLLENLSNFFLKVQPAPYERLLVEPENVLLHLEKGRNCWVYIYWYKLYLRDRSYLLGVIHDYEEDRQKELNFEVNQEQLRELSQNLFRVQDDERQLLADELHDGLCQSLAALKMQVFRVEKAIDDEENREDCRKARQFIAQIIEDVRRLSHDLSPVILNDLGLSGALAHLVNNFAALNDLKVSVSVPDLEGCFSDDEARNIYRIVQEAVNNVAKHAQASLLILEAELLDDKVCFRISDDGVGFGGDNPPAGGRVEAGLGLTSMAQRVRLLGGDFSVSAKPGAGCVVTFTLPKG
jgi:signal transduction histidine kinase